MAPRTGATAQATVMAKRCREAALHAPARADQMVDSGDLEARAIGLRVLQLIRATSAPSARHGTPH